MARQGSTLSHGRASRSRSGRRASSTKSPVEAPAPSLLITAVATPIPEGQPAFFKITASRAVAGDTIVHVLIGTGEHIMVTLPANATTVEFSVPTVSDGKHGTASPPATASLEDGTTATVVLGDIDPPPPSSGAAYEARPVPKRENSFDFFQTGPVEERGVSSIQRGEAVWLCEEIKALNLQVACVVR